MELAIYPVVIQHSYGKSPLVMGESTINGPFSIAMLNYQSVEGNLEGISMCILPVMDIYSAV